MRRHFPIHHNMGTSPAKQHFRAYSWLSSSKSRIPRAIEDKTNLCNWHSHLVIQRTHIAHLEKNRMLAELSATISHEIRNPLTSIRGFLQLIQKSDPSISDRRRYADFALSGVDQAITLLTDSLNYAKPLLT